MRHHPLVFPFPPPLLLLLSCAGRSAKRRGPPLHSAATELSIGAETLPRRSGRPGVVAARRADRDDRPLAVPQPVRSLDPRRAFFVPRSSSSHPSRPCRPLTTLVIPPAYPIACIRVIDIFSSFSGRPLAFPDWSPWLSPAPVFCPWPLRAASGACDYAFESQVPEVARGRLEPWASIHRWTTAGRAERKSSDAPFTAVGMTEDQIERQSQRRAAAVACRHFGPCQPLLADDDISGAQRGGTASDHFQP